VGDERHLISTQSSQQVIINSTCGKLTSLVSLDRKIASSTQAFASPGVDKQSNHFSRTSKSELTSSSLVQVSLKAHFHWVISASKALGIGPKVRNTVTRKHILISHKADDRMGRAVPCCTTFNLISS